MKATEAIERNINSSQREIEEINNLISKACENNENYITVPSLSSGARWYYEYNGFELEEVVYKAHAFKPNEEHIEISWSIKHLQKLAAKRQELINKGLGKKKESNHSNSNFLAGVVLGGILF